MYWSARPLDLPASSDSAVRVLRRQIRIGAIRPGERLPSERQLALELGISRVTLREALRILETDGFLTVRRGAGGGTFVAGDEALDTIASAALFADVAGAWRAVEFIEASVGKACQLAATRKSPGDVQAIRDAVVKMSQAVSAGDVREALLVFLTGVGKASGNRFLEEAIEIGLDAAFHPIGHDAVPAIAAGYLERFPALLDAIKAEDAMSAERAALSTSEFIGRIVGGIVSKDQFGQEGGPR